MRSVHQSSLIFWTAAFAADNQKDWNAMESLWEKEENPWKDDKAGRADRSMSIDWEPLR
jgi:hypothetical protein